MHFLKIDVDGHEKSVIEGLNLDLHCPWIVVIESTLPNSTVQSHKQWQSLIINNNYSMVYFDGLNRYYCANEHLHLKKYFKTPPNVFDSFTRYNEYRAVNLLSTIKHQLTNW